VRVNAGKIEEEAEVRAQACAARTARRCATRAITICLTDDGRRPHDIAFAHEKIRGPCDRDRATTSFIHIREMSQSLMPATRTREQALPFFFRVFCLKRLLRRYSYHAHCGALFSCRDRRHTGHVDDVARYTCFDIRRHVSQRQLYARRRTDVFAAGAKI